MIAYIRAYLRDCREGWRILRTREFWRAVYIFYAVTVPRRLNAWAEEKERERRERN